MGPMHTATTGHELIVRGQYGPTGFLKKAAYLINAKRDTCCHRRWCWWGPFNRHITRPGLDADEFCSRWEPDDDWDFIYHPYGPSRRREA